ncbi:MAG TPA: ATP-dependent Clp protease proteolytic subunit [Bacteroidales bacterium]|nr:ATP-dependent Clp protease proteolytic subunit [Bacteroidales bacterium]HOH22605.1 ATP-dependent Clp protease proteolytic subunit [Bacteroidales bacterium]HPZ03911.1 ATP-dependent Clp protease proteolytic subunit [Bacteroidales bacterium]HQB75461.1 ATP-dependent Clp protease proteolytic subunit [Bacteroidales bacterium]
MQIFDRTIKEILNQNLEKLETHFKSDVIFYYGEIHPSYEKIFRDFIEMLKEDTPGKDRLTIVLNTPGGNAETVEKMVEIIRHHYKEVYFVVPDYAMSAGTIFCMSGDKIFMDYSSSLGPIDPQVFNGTTYVPALGYLDKVNELLEKAQNGTLTQAEFLILQNQDLALLRSYEQAKELTITLLKKWLVEYKFKDWTKHRTDSNKIGKSVTLKEKIERAEEIADKLGNNKIWHSHGRMINITTLVNTLRLEIEDYSDDPNLRTLIRNYNDLLTEFIVRNGFKVFLHSRKHF